MEVPEPGTLDRSARCVSFWIEPEDDAFAREVCQFDLVSLVVRYLEIGRTISDIQHGFSLDISVVQIRIAERVVLA